MSRLLFAAFVMIALAPVPALADLPALAGSWKGPWYIGMSSGMVTMQISADGSGTIALTNMDEFGTAPVALGKADFDGKILKFSAAGANGAVLTVGLQSENEGRKLRGNGKYGGFGTRMELQRAD